MANPDTTKTAQTTLTAASATKQATVDSSGKEMIHIKVFSPYKTYYNFIGYSISGVNDTGPFDILPRHHNFITLLNPCVLDIRVQSGSKRIRISKGVMHVKADKVVVFLDV
jgi:F0F1-type ATP synthase epsilon subunit